MSKNLKSLKLFAYFFIIIVLVFIGIQIFPMIQSLVTKTDAVAGPPTPMAVTIEQDVAQVDPTSVLSATFKVTFSSAIDAATFTTADIETSGSTAPGVVVSSVTEVAPNNGTTYSVVITSTGVGTIVPTIPVSTSAYGAMVANYASVVGNGNGLTVDDSDNIYAVSNSGEVNKITPAGVSTVIANTGLNPSRVITDAAGNLYVTNAGSDTVSKITPAGVVTLYANVGDVPNDLVFDSAGNLYVTNDTGNSVSKIPPGGGSSSVFATGVGAAKGIVIDTSGNLFVADAIGNQIFKITPAGVVSTFATFPAQAHELAIDSANNVYVTHNNFSTVSKISPAGVVTTFTGFATSPAGIAIDSQDNVFVTMTLSSDVKMISAAGVVTSMGTAGTFPAATAIDSVGNVYIRNSGGTISKLPYNLTTGVRSSAGAGNAASTSTDNTVTIITATPGTLPSIPDMTSATDSGISSTDDLTNINLPVFTGTCLTGETVTIKVDGVVASSATTCVAGVYTITPTAAIADGPHNITAFATNGSGDSADTAALPIVIDTTVPATLAAPDMTSATDSGTSNTDNVTSDTTPDFTGTCVDGDTIQLVIDAVAVAPTAVCAGGVYTITPTTPLTDGAHTVAVTATDPAGNVSAVSPTISVTIDTTVPTTLVAPDMTAATDSGASNIDNFTSDTTPDFTGTCTDGDTIQLVIDAVAVAPTAVCAGGVYTITPTTPLTDGVHTVGVTATDPAGNVSAISPTISATIDTTIPTTLVAPDMTPATDNGSSNTDNLTNDTTPDFTGTCIDGDIIQLVIDAVAVAPTVVCAGGVYTITPANPLTDGAHTVGVTATDPAGNISAISPTLPVTIDTAVPPALTTPDLTSATDSGLSNTDNLTNDTTPDITGTCVNGDTIQLVIDAVAVAPTVVCTGGVYTITPTTPLTDGVHTIGVTTTDPAGNVSPLSPTISVTIDATAPTTLVAPDMTPTTDSGFSNTDNVTSDTTPDFTGTCVNGDRIQLVIDTVTVAPTVVCAGGVYSITPAIPLTDGVHTIGVTATDPAGNVSAVSPTISATIDTTVPTTLVAPDMTPATDSGLSNTDNVTSDTTPDFTGTCVNGDTIQLVIDTVAVAPTVVCAGGVYTITPTTPLTDGVHTIGVTATDPAGNVGTISPTVSVTIDTTVPTTLVAPDMTPATDKGSSNIDNLTNDTTPDFTGSCVNGDTIQLVIDAVAVAPTVVCAGGVYTITPTTPLTDGIHTISVTATDPAGNVSAISPTLSVTIDTVIPPAATINPIASTDTTITGTGETGSTITVTGAVCTNLPVIVNSAGVWSCTLSAPIPNGTVVTVVQTDVSGNPSNPTTSTVYNPLSVSATPTINPINTLDPVVTGTGVSGSTITISGATCTNSPIIVTVGPNGKGTWSCTLSSSLPVNTIVSATASEPNKSPSGPATTKVSDATKTSPSAPVFDPTDGTPISGTGEPGSTVTVTGPNNTVICNALVAANGTWSCIPVNVPPYGTVITATQEDPDGNVSPPSSIVVDRFNLYGSVWVDANLNGVKEESVFLPGVTINLLAMNGDILKTTVTDANGNYEFNNLLMGQYVVREAQPTGYGSTTPNTIYVNIKTSDIKSLDFGENVAPSIEGSVYVDLNDDGIRQLTEVGIENVVVNLSNGKVAKTNISGYYIFSGLVAGSYDVREDHPLEYLDGKDRVGTNGTSMDNDKIIGVVLAAIDNSLNNDFGEQLPTIDLVLVGYSQEELTNAVVEIKNPDGSVTKINLKGSSTAKLPGLVNGKYEFVVINQKDSKPISIRYSVVLKGYEKIFIKKSELAPTGSNLYLVIFGLILVTLSIKFRKLKFI